jgi:hypothetical protein
MLVNSTEYACALMSSAFAGFAFGLSMFSLFFVREQKNRAGCPALSHKHRYVTKISR